MTNEEIKELEKRTYAIGWSEFPIDAFFNDIRDNNNPNFNKYLAYQDFKKIIDEIYRLKDKAKKYDDKETPKKIIKIDKKDIDGVRKESITDIVGYMCECPNCKKIFGWLSISPYCRFCGQALDWSDGDDK